MAGGRGGGPSTSEMYDITSGEWSSTGNLTSDRIGMRMVVLGDNILAMGGHDGGSTSSSVDKFNLTSMEWKFTEEMLVPRNSFAVTGVPPSAISQN